LGAAHTAATFFEGREGRKKQGANAVGGGDRDPEARRRLAAKSGAPSL